MHTISAGGRKTYDMAYIALFTVLIIISAWISIPTAVPFTMQTFGVFAAITILGGRRGTVSILIYILLGAVGLPVFSGFKGGFGALFGQTGGFIFGFLFSALLMWGMEKLFGKKSQVLLISMLLGLFLCYAVGTLWFVYIYGKNMGEVGIGIVLGWCVLPFLIPDFVKLGLAYVLASKLRKYVV